MIERWLGALPYREALERMLAHHAALVAGRAPEELWLLEHPAVITTGRRPAPGLPSPQRLEELGLEVIATDRGGLATWHGPGQLVAYLLLDLRPRRWGARDIVCRVESGIIGALAELGLEAGRRSGLPGIWVGRDKIAALGLNLEGGCSRHGLALNLHPDLSIYDQFLPCGIIDGGTTSLERCTGLRRSPAEVAPILSRHLRLALALDACGGTP